MLVPSACSSDAETVEQTPIDSAAETSGFVRQLDVQASIEMRCAGTSSAGPPDTFEVVDGVVALPSSPSHPALQTSERDAADGSKYFFAKTGLFWKSNASFELTIPDDQRSRMAIGWGGPAPHAHSIVVNCDGSDDWLGLAGGYWVTEPFCADLVIRSAGSEKTIQIGLGTPCAGQEPPQGHSDG